MTKRTAAIAAALVIASLLFYVLPAAAIEKLSETEMREVTGQAGISAAVGDGVMVIHTPTLILQDVDTVDRFGNPLATDGHISFKTRALLKINESFSLDIGMPYKEETLTFTDQTGSGEESRSFEHPLSDLAMVALTQQSNTPFANAPFYTFSTENISVYNHDLSAMTALGDLNLSGLEVFESRASFFPPAIDDGCGIRAVSGTRTQIKYLEYENPDQEMKAALSDIMIGAAFTGDALPEGESSSNQLDTGTWAFDEGMFQLGIPYYYHDDPESPDTDIHTYPFTMDVAYNEDRSGDFQTYIRINAPMQGALRIQNIASDNFDMGAVAIDGIRLYKNVVEFPGRGIGH